MFSDLYIGALCLVLVHIYPAEAEPKCSSYHYEEKLLEKMIRMEFAMENFKTEMTTLQSKVQSSLTDLNAEKNRFTKELNEFNTMIEARVNQTIDAAKNKLLEIDELDERLTDSMKKTEDKIMFSVREAKSNTLSSGQTMLYKTILENERNGYDIDTGIFTAPVDGLYLFNVQFCMHGDKHIDFAFVAGEESFKIARIQRRYWDSCYDFNAFKYLNVGDKVRIKIISASSGAVLYELIERLWNTFSGTLMNM